MIFHEHGWGTTDSKLFQARVHFENVLVCHRISVHHVLRLDYLVHVLLDSRRNVSSHVQQVLTSCLRWLLINRVTPEILRLSRRCCVVVHVEHAQLVVFIH
jgi:hypothetical protein